MNREYIYLGVIALLVLVTGFIITNTFFTMNNVEQQFAEKTVELEIVEQELSELDNNLFLANKKIIELQENNKYLENRFDLKTSKLSDLQETYNELWDYSTSCFWANICSYDTISCEEHFTWGNDLGYDAQDYYVYFSDECDLMNNEWNKFKTKSIGD